MGGKISSNDIVVDINREFLPKQLEVLEAVKHIRYVLYSGAVRAGKTLLLTNVAIRTCIDNPGCVGMLGSLTTPQLTDVVFLVFKQELQLYQDALDKAGIPITLAKIKSSKGDMKAVFWNGSLIHFKPCDDEMKIRGLTLDFAGLDEPIDIDESIFKQLINRISGTGNVKNPFIILTTNPGSQSHWIYRRFFKENKEDYKTFQTTTYDNVLLPRYGGFINEVKETGDEDWIRRFLDGTWDAFAGQIYKGFKTSKCVGEYKNLKLKNFQYITAGVDWGLKNPSCILTIAVTKDKDVYVLDEYYRKDKPSHFVAREIAERHERYHYKKAWCDPSNPDLILQTVDLRVPADKADRNVDAGIGKIKSIIKLDKLHIDSSCVNLIREMQMYQYKKDKMGENPVEKPIKLDDHAPDALRYGLTNYRAFRSVPIIGWVKRDLWDFPGRR